MTKPGRVLAALACAVALTVGTFTVAPPAAAAEGWARYDCALPNGSPYWSDIDVLFERNSSFRLVVTLGGTLPTAYGAGSIFASLEFTLQPVISGIHNATAQGGDFFAIERTTSPVLGATPYKIALNFYPAPGPVNCYLISGTAYWPGGGI